MKRDMDLIRAILLEVEAMDFSGTGEIPELELDGWDGHLVYGHARLLRNAAYLDVTFTAGSPPGMHVIGLTWQGHELLDSIRDDGVWAAVKAKVAKVGGSVALELLKPLAVQVVREGLGLTDGE